MEQLTAKEVKEMLNEGKTLNIIDVREVDEVAEGKIPNVIHIPLGLLEFKIQDLDKSKEYIMVCHSGARSGRASQLLKGQGFKVINMIGGMVAWEGEKE